MRGNAGTLTVNAGLRGFNKPSNKPKSIYQVEEATHSDIAQMAQLKKEVCQETYKEYKGKGLDKWLEENCTEAHYKWRLGRKHYKTFVIKKGDEVLATGLYRQRGKRADISGVYVKKKRQGLGQILMEKIKEEAKKEGCNRARASIFRSNTEAQQFFTRKHNLQKTRGFREKTLKVMVDHYEGEI